MNRFIAVIDPPGQRENALKTRAALDLRCPRRVPGSTSRLAGMQRATLDDVINHLSFDLTLY